MSLIRLGRTERYSSLKTRIPGIADSLTRSRFSEMKKHLYFIDSTKTVENSSEAYKFKILYDTFNERCSEITVSEKTAVDELIIPYQSDQTSLRLYNPKNSKKWGLKVFCLCGIGSNVYKTELYEGKTPETSSGTVGKSGQKVIRLAERLPKNRNYKMFFDNGFSSPQLIFELLKKGIFRSDERMRSQGRGMCEKKVLKMHSGTLTATKWWDNKAVTLVSSYIGKNALLAK